MSNDNQRLLAIADINGKIEGVRLSLNELKSKFQVPIDMQISLIELIEKISKEFKTC